VNKLALDIIIVLGDGTEVDILDAVGQITVL